MKSTKSIDILRVKDDSISKEEDILIIEYPFTIYLNDKEIITLLCSPKSLKELTLGFLYSEGFIYNISEVERIQLHEEKGVVYVYLNKERSLNDEVQGKRTITSGGCKGTSFNNVLDSFKSKKIETPLDIKIEEIKSLVKEFNNKSQLFLDTGGVHSCALCNRSRIIMFEEDIGRHNALDKLLGRALMDDIDLSDKLVLSSGRISSEMLIKIAKRGIPALVSRSAPTSLSVELARKLNIILVGFARGEKMNIYSKFQW